MYVHMLGYTYKSQCCTRQTEVNFERLAIYCTTYDTKGFEDFCLGDRKRGRLMPSPSEKCRKNTFSPKATLMTFDRQLAVTCFFRALLDLGGWAGFSLDSLHKKHVLVCFKFKQVNA